MPFELFCWLPRRITCADQKHFFPVCMHEACMWCAIESGLQTLFSPRRSLMFYCNFFAVHSPFLQEASHRVWFFLVKFLRPKTENLRNSMFVCKCSKMLPTANLLYGLHLCSAKRLYRIVHICVCECIHICPCTMHMCV